MIDTHLLSNKWDDPNDEYYRYLTQLLYNFTKKGGKVDYNQYQLQSKNPNITTCGNWVIARLIFRNLSTEHFAQLFRPPNSDKLVVEFTSLLR